jgi:hypothetical protein
MFWAVVSLFVLGETILNGVFLSQGNELGLIGGIVSALVIMAINLAIAIFFSSLLRKANSVQKNQRIMAWSGMAVLLPTYLTFILLIGHYRDCVESDPFNASRQAVTDLLSTPFAIDDTFSWILILFSILMFDVV